MYMYLIHSSTVPYIHPPIRSIHPSDPSTNQIYPPIRSIHQSDPSTHQIHPPIRSIHQSDPSTNQIYPPIRSIHPSDPYTHQIHPSIHPSDPSIHLIPSQILICIHPLVYTCTCTCTSAAIVPFSSSLISSADNRPFFLTRQQSTSSISFKSRGSQYLLHELQKVM